MFEIWLNAIMLFIILALVRLLLKDLPKALSTIGYN